MLTQKLFEHVLIDPAKRGGKRLYIVSGYATPAMAFHHLNLLREKGFDINIELILGMCAKEGLGQSTHLGFKELVEKDFKDSFKCSYMVKMPPVHSKIYAWFDGDKPVAGFSGSANYTQTAFGREQREVMIYSKPEDCLDYFNSLVPDTIYCDHNDADRDIIVYNDREFEYRQRMGRLTAEIAAPSGGTKPAIIGLKHVTISLLDDNGNLPQSSGLNWGQRPQYNREPNQAYIRVPAKIDKMGFFPPRGEHFTIITDDDRVLICTRAQAGSKAIESPHNNSLIGQYFRFRLGLANGQRVLKTDLVKYGRTDVDFYKLDNETYFMDFSPP